MAPKSYKKCAVLDCKSCKGKTVHTFPVSTIPREKVWLNNILKKWITFCNNPEITLENENNLQWMLDFYDPGVEVSVFDYEQTPKISPYLFAICAGPYKVFIDEEYGVDYLKIGTDELEGNDYRESNWWPNLMTGGQRNQATRLDFSHEDGTYNNG